MKEEFELPCGGTHGIVVKAKWKGGHPPTFRAASEIKEEDFIKMLSLSKLFIARTLLCATIVTLGAQGQHTRNSTTLSAPSAGNFVITCQPGFVFRCNQFGCFCVKP